MQEALGSFRRGDRQHGPHRRDVQSGAGFLQALRAGLSSADGEAATHGRQPVRSASTAEARARTTTSSISASSAKTGLIWRYGTTDVSPEIRERLENELDDHRREELLLLLPDRLGLLQLRPRERHPRRRQRLGRRHDGRLPAGPVQRRSDQVRPALRAVHGPEPQRDARYRYRHLPGRPRRRSSTTSATNTATSRRSSPSARSRRRRRARTSAACSACRWRRSTSSPS